MMMAPVLWLLIVATSLSIILKDHLAYTIPMSFIIVALLIMVGGYIENLKIGLLLTTIFPIFALTILIKKRYLLKQNITKFAKDNIVIVALFILIFIYLCIYHSSSYFNSWDEFSHWGPMVRGMYNSDKLYSYLNSNIGHKDYPPLFQCIEWMFCFLSGSFSESSVYIGLGIFTFSLFFPVLKTITGIEIKKQIKYALLLLVLVLCIISVDYQMYVFLQCIELDMSMGIVAGTAAYMVLYFKNNRNNNLLIMFYLIAVLLTKEIGLAFYLISLSLIIVIRVLTNKEKNLMTMIVLFVIVPLLFFFSWKIYVKDVGQGQFALSKINLLKIINTLLFGSGESWQLIVRDSFLLGLFNKNIFGTSLPSSPFFQVFLFLLVVFTLLNHKYYKKYEFAASITLILDACGYIFTMLVLYESCFSVEEATNLASYSRYFGTFVLFFITLIVLFIYQNVYENNKADGYYLIVGVVASLLFVSNSKVAMLAMNRHKVNQSETSEFKSFVSQVENNCDVNDRILIIDESGIRLPTVTYYFDKGNNFGCHVLQSEYNQDDFINIYKNKYNYVYVWNANDSLRLIWKEVNNSSVNCGELYKVSGDNLISNY